MDIPVVQVLKIVFGTPEYDEYLNLRYLILRKPLGLEFTPDSIKEEWNCFHFGGYDSCNQLIACLMFEKIDSQTLKMRQVAVSNRYQSRGVGKQMVKKCEKWAIAQNFSKIELLARSNAVNFYLGLSYTIDEFNILELGIPHNKMSKILKVHPVSLL